MPQGSNISAEKRMMIWDCFYMKRTELECQLCIFGGSEHACSLRHIKKLYRMFNNPLEEEAVAKYLSGTAPRGKTIVTSWWYDDLVRQIIDLKPYISIQLVRLEVQSLIVDTGFDTPCKASIGESVLRAKGNRKRCKYLSNAQDPLQIWHHMDKMKAVETKDIVNWDETSCSAHKFYPIYGRGEGEVVINNWRIGNKTYSAIAAMSHLGFLKATKIYDVACDSSTICHFLENLQPFLLPTSVGLFDNASVNTCEASLQVSDRVFNGRWARVAPNSPRLSPIERGFSLVWTLVRSRWAEAQRNPIRVLEECFDYYSIGSPGGHMCSAFFNIYRRNNGELPDTIL